MKVFKSVFSVTMLAIIFSMTSVFSYAASLPSNPGNENPSNAKLNIHAMSVEQILSLSKKDYVSLREGKVSAKEKLVFKMVQKELRKAVKKEKIDKNAKMDFAKFMDEAKSKFNIGGFVLGFLLGLIGVALAHIFSKDKDFRRSSWQGLGAWIILLLIIVLI